MLCAWAKTCCLKMSYDLRPRPLPSKVSSLFLFLSSWVSCCSAVRLSLWNSIYDIVLALGVYLHIFISLYLSQFTFRWLLLLYKCRSRTNERTGKETHPFPFSLYTYNEWHDHRKITHPTFLPCLPTAGQKDKWYFIYSTSSSISLLHSDAGSLLELCVCVDRINYPLGLSWVFSRCECLDVLCWAMKKMLSLTVGEKNTKSHFVLS